MIRETDEEFRAMFGRLLADGAALRASVLAEHARAWDDMTVRRLIRDMDEVDLFRLLAATSPLVRPGSEIDAWLHDLVQREELRRERTDAGRAA